MGLSFSNTLQSNNRTKLSDFTNKSVYTPLLLSPLSSRLTNAQNTRRAGANYVAPQQSGSNTQDVVAASLAGPLSVSDAWKKWGATKTYNNEQGSFTDNVPTATATGSTYTPQSAQGTSSRSQQISDIAAQAQEIQNRINNMKQTTTPSTDASQVRGLFPSVLSELRSASSASKDQKKALALLQKEAARNQEISDRARALSEQYGSEIARVGKLGAGAVAGNLTTGTDVVGRGNAAIASQSASERMNALAQAQNAALAGTGQELQGTQQAANAYTNALSGATNIQGQQISGLGATAGLAAPSVASYGQTVFNPVTGQYEGGTGGLDPYQAANDLAAKVQSGQLTYEQAIQSLGYAGGVGQQILNQALGGGFNPNLASATIAGQAGVFGTLPQLQSAETAATGIKDKIASYLVQNPNLNPNELVLGNKLQQWIEGKQLGDPKYQTFFNFLNEYTNTLAPILGVGGDPTNLKTEIAQGFINAAASGQSINEVLNNIQTLATGKLQDMRSGALGGGAVSNPSISNPSIGGGGGGFAEAW